MLVSSAHGKCNSNTDSGFDSASMFSFSFSTTRALDNDVRLNNNTQLKRRHESDDLGEDCRSSKVPRIQPLSINAQLAMHFMSADPTVRYSEAHDMAVYAVAKLHALHADAQYKRITRGIRCCSGNFRDYHFAPKNPRERCNCARGVIYACIKTLAKRSLYNNYDVYANKRRRIHSERKHYKTSAEYVAICIRERQQAKQSRINKQVCRRMRERRRILIDSTKTISSCNYESVNSSHSVTSTTTISSPTTTATACTDDKTPVSLSSASTGELTSDYNVSSAEVSESGNNTRGNKIGTIATEINHSYRIRNSTKVGVEVDTTANMITGNRNSLVNGGKTSLGVTVLHVSPESSIDRVHNAPTDSLRVNADRFFDTLGEPTDFVNNPTQQTSEMAINCEFSDNDSDTDYGYYSDYSTVSDDSLYIATIGSTVDRLAIVFQAAARISTIAN
ncbi:hypothetical protein GGI05_005581 [Coemansia sp. RSA 2603]|nr:hypothetical protein GGI05_005581 [Coemansia sp. RSA 2603]